MTLGTNGLWEAPAMHGCAGSTGSFSLQRHWSETWMEAIRTLVPDGLYNYIYITFETII